MLTPNQLENYALEIISRGRTIRKTCESLLSQNYSTPAPERLAVTIMRICEYLEDAIVSICRSTEQDAESIAAVLNILTIMDLKIKRIGSHVRYIDGARSERLPWSIIPAFQKRIKKLMPGVNIMLRPQWKYNYSIDLSDLWLAYYNALIEYQGDVSEKSLEGYVLQKIKSPFYLISFPSLERKNILLHALVGHEIGHLYAEKYLTAEKKNEFSKAVMPDIELLVEKELQGHQLPEGELFQKAYQEARKVDLIEEALRCWKRGLEELLSDIVGAILFGPAAILSCYELAIQQGLDFLPSAETNYYPPWRMRLREILSVLEQNGIKLFPIGDEIFNSPEKKNKVNKLFEQITEVANGTEDKDMIEKDPTLRLSYNQIYKDLQEGTKYFLDELKLKDELVSSDRLYSTLGHLVERLEHQIPPNAIEKNVNEREPANLVGIINAAWFYKLSCYEPLLSTERAFNEKSYAWRDRLNNLTLKAIEYSDIEQDYLINNGKPETFKWDE